MRDPADTPEPGRSTKPLPSRIRSVVDVRRHPTVVRLEHLEAEDAEWITSSYYITSAIEAHLTALRNALAQDQGCGIFLIGQYGSGKSHFLGYVTRALEHAKLLDDPPEVVTESLLNYRGDVTLEEIVTRTLGLETHSGDRRDTWKELASRAPRGLLLILDELSEFLRSKPNPNAFTEDVRFLQFMGEWAQGERFWILSSMQEQIEHTGDLDHGLYRKIKDRYPMRFLLPPAHVRDLIRDAILIKKHGYDDVVDKIAQEVQRALPSSPLDQQDLRALYPIHPATLQLLEEVRDCFSQSRGIIDFAVTRLAGNASRGVEPFLDRPLGELMTPDAIVDHFSDLFELQSEFLPIAQKVLPYFRKHLPILFEKKPARELAKKVVDLLILIQLSPTRDRLTAEDCAFWLLYRVSKIDPAKNVKVLGRILDHLQSQGQYIKRDAQGYALDLDDDGDSWAEKRLAREMNELRGLGDNLFEQLGTLLESRAFNPFTLPRERLQSRTLRWHYHPRAYTVFLGHGEPDLPDDKTANLVCLRLPWGEASPCPSAFTICPKSLQQQPHHLELAALARLREASRSTPKLDQRFEEKLTLFEGEVRAAYAEGQMHFPTGPAETMTPLPPSLDFSRWLERQTEIALKRLYPGFERFAPAYGPLPTETYRQFYRTALNVGLCTPDVDDAVNLLREAYLLPMGLLAREGRGYRIPGNLDRHELVRLIVSVVEHNPSPKVLSDRLAQPIYGLVKDQVNVLLLFLITVGELDLTKNGKSYAELHETFPLVDQYDAVVAGRTLSLEHLKNLELLCEGLSIRHPSPWTVIAQKRAIERLSETGQQLADHLHGLVFELAKLEQGDALRTRIKSFLDPWRSLSQAENALDGFQQFLYEIGPVPSFLATHTQLRELPARLERLLDELRRYKHLLDDPILTQGAFEDYAIRREALGLPPTLDDIDAVDRWLESARTLYAEFREAYSNRHGEWWQEHRSHPLWTYKAPPIASSRLVGLGRELEQLERCREEARRYRCDGEFDARFQAACRCGFDGTTSPTLAPLLDSFESARRRVEDELTHFFAKEDVREKIREWAEQGLGAPESTSAYLDRDAPFPSIERLDLLDRHLAGLDLVKSIDWGDIHRLLESRTWSPEEVISCLQGFFRDRQAVRLRFESREEAGNVSTSPLWAWSLKTALSQGLPLPADMDAQALTQAWKEVRREDIAPEAIARVESLNLPEPIVDSIASLVLEGALPLPKASNPSPLIDSISLLLQPPLIETFEQLASTSSRLYRSHHRMNRLAKEDWLPALDRLADVDVPSPWDALSDRLTHYPEAQWIVIDCFGLPWVEPLSEDLVGMFGAWRESSFSFARVGRESTTEAFYQDLATSGTQHAFYKLNALDRLIHERFEAFDLMARLAKAELAIVIPKIVAKLDPKREVLIFADHGFRLSIDGQRYEHGGSSTLERTVPLYHLVPR